MRMKKILSLILTLCMLIGLCQFSFTATADVAARTVTMTTTEFDSDAETFPVSISVPDGAYWWAAIYPASATTYTSSGYADYLDGTNTGGDYEYPSGQSIRMRNWPLAAGEYKVVLFADGGYQNVADECYFSVKASGDVEETYGKLSLSKETYVVGEEIVLNYSNSASAKDFVSVYTKANENGTTNASGELAWVYTADEEGSVTQNSFSKQYWASNPGEYVFKYWQADQYNVEMDRVYFSIVEPPVPDELVTEVYVSASGSDVAAGTAEAPLATMARAMKFLDTAQDCTIYVSGSVAFADVAHEGNFTYVTADDTALFNTDVSLNGPSEIKVSVDTQKTIRTNGFDTVMNNPIDSSKFNYFVAGNNDGTDETVTFKGGYVYQNVYTKAAGDNAGDVNFVVDGGIVRMVAPGVIANDNVTEWKQNVLVTVNSGELWYFNAGSSTAGSHVDGAFMAAFNNDTYTKFKADYLKQGADKVIFDKGYWIVKSADTEGNTLTPTNTPGKFAVSGEKTAWIQSADKKSAYYSHDGYITIPAWAKVLNIQINWVDEFSTSLLADAPASDMPFLGWEDDGEGTITAKYLDKYYVASTGSDDNAGTPDAPLATIAKAIEKKGASKDQTIVIMDTIAFADAAHTGVVTYEAYSDEAGAFNSAIVLNGPTVLKTPISGGRNLTTNGHYIEIDAPMTTDNKNGISELFTNGANGSQEIVFNQGFINALRFNTSDAVDMTIDGGVLRMISTYPENTDININVHSGEFWYMNHYYDKQPLVTVEGAYQVVFNAGTKLRNNDWMGGKIEFSEGKYVVTNPETDNTILATETAGKFAVEGEKDAYYVTSDGKTVYYSYNGYITLPAGNTTVLWADEFSADTVALPAGAMEWIDDGEGTLTASFVRETYYVSATGNDDNLGSEEAPLATIAEAINRKGADKDFTIYVMGALYPFADVAHTGTITYEPYDENATLAGGTIKVNGPSKIHVNIGAFASIYPNGYDFELDGDVNSSLKHDIFVGNSEGRPNKVALNGQYIRYLACFSDDDDGTSDTLITIDGARFYMLCPTPVTKGSAAKMGNIRVVVNSGAIDFFNEYNAPADNSTDSSLVFVFNNNTHFHEFTWDNNNFTTTQDWGTNKIWFKGGEMLWRSADTEGNYIVPKSITEYEVVGNKTAYYQTADKNTVYYSVDGKITLPVLSNHKAASDKINIADISWTDDFSASMFALPEGAVEWSDDGNGTLTASYESLTYYVSAEGSDENAGSETAPLATIAEAIERRGADEDFTIYVMGTYTFADAAHTGTITYEPYDENAKLAGGNINISGPSIINVNTAAAAHFYANGHYLEIDGTVNRSIGNKVTMGSLGATPVETVLKGQYFADVYAQYPGQQGGDAHLIIDGAVVYNCRPGPGTAGSVPSVFGNFRVTVNSGELLFSNTIGTVDTTYKKDTDAFLTLVFNNNRFFDITPHVFANVERTNFLNYVTGNANFNGGEAIWRSAEADCFVTSTSEHGVYEVSGDKVAYFQTSDKKTAYYTYNGKIILPDVVNGNILWADEFSTDLLTTPGQQDGIDFVKWVDDGKGTLTASYKKDPSTYEFYLKAGGTGDGKSVNTPAGTVADVIKSIKADGHAAGSEVTVYIIDSGEKREHGDALTNDVIANYVIYQVGEAHDAKITFTTYDYANTKKPAVLYLNNALVHKSNNNTTLAPRGPEVFENLIIVDCRTDHPTDVYMQGHDAGFINVDFRRAKGDATSASIVDKDSPLYAMQNRGGSGGFAEGGTIIIDNAKTFGEIAYSGYADTANYDTTANNDVTFVIKNTAANGAPNVYTNINQPVAVTVFKKNMNLVLDNSTIPTFTKNSADVIVEGAIQVVLNNGSVLTNFDAYKSAKASADAELGTAKWFVMDSRKNAGTLDITDTAGKFAINADGKVAFAYSNDTRTAYYGSEYLTIGESGSYVVNYVATVDDVIKALPELEPDSETGELFTGWTDNKDGTITASFAAKTAETREYYVVNGGTGDGRSATTPAASVYDVVASVNADKLIKGDTAVIYIMEHPDFIDETTGKFGDYGKISTKTELVKGLFTYWRQDGGYLPEHTATLKITSYDYEEGNPAKPMKHVAYSDKIGANHMMGLSGPVIFEDVAIVRPRNVDREIRTNGYDVEFNNTIIYQTNGDFYTSTPFTGLVEDHANVIAGGDSETSLGGTLRFNSRLIASRKNNHGIGVRAYGKATTFTEPVAIYLNNSEINSQFNWGNATESYSVTLNAGLSIVSNAFTNIIYPTNANYLNDSPVNIAGGLQIVNNNGMIFPEVPANVNADATWIVNSAKDAGGTLDITETAGTFKVLGGKYAWAQSFDKKTVWYGNDTITLPAGTYTINYADSFDALKTAVATPADIDEYNLFDTWKDDGNGTLTAQYKYVIPTYYVAATGGSDDNDGLTPATAFATTTKAITVIEANDKNGVINVIGAVTLDLVDHENKIYVESYNGGTVAGASNKISLRGPIVINADFTAAQAITTNGYYLELGGKVNNAQNNTITAGNLNGTDEKIVLNGKFIHKLTTTLQNQKTGGLEIFIDGGILRQVSTGSGVENDGTYVVGNFSVTVKSGEFWCLNHSDAGPHKTPAVFNYIANGNSYYFPDGRPLLSSVNIKSWADYTPSGSDGFVKILFEGGKYVIRNADKENFIYMGEAAGQFTYEGAKTPYYIAENGLTVNYGKDGKINLPTGEVDVIWTEEFKAEDMPEPTLASGYEFGGWADDGNGTLTALVINPNFYYVDGENGDDANLGTKDAPFKTISKAISSLNGKNGTVYVLGNTEYDLTADDKFAGYVTIQGVGEDIALNATETFNIVGNTTFKNLTIGEEGYDTDVALLADARVEFCDDMVYNAETVIDCNGHSGKFVTDGGSYWIGNGKNIDVVANGSGITFFGAFEGQVNVSADDSAILADTFDGFDAKANIVVNNCEVDPEFYNMENVTLVMSASENGSRVDLSAEDGKFGVKAEYGKTPIAVAEDGTIYVADKFTTEDIAPATWYDSDNYSQYINYRRPLNNTYKKLTEDKELTVAYFGGSVTNGSGKADCWRALIGQWLIDNFPEATVTNINRACGESGTYLGTFRLQGDVIAVQPDLVFLEYSINDKYYGSSYANAASQYETIVREIKQALPEADIVTVLVSDTGTFSVNKQGKLHTQAQAHEDMAAIYGIPTLHVGRRIAEVCNYTASNFTGTYGTDGVHLTSAGNYIYYQVIEEFCHNSLLRTDFAGLPVRNDELPVTQNVLFDGNRTWYEPSADLISKSEALGGSGVDFVNTPSYGGSFEQLEAGQLVTESVGQFRFNSVNDEFFFEFEGTDVALWSDYYKDNYFRISIDGAEYKDVAGTSHAPARIVEGLASGKHTIGIKIKDASTSLTIRSIYTRDTSKATPAGTSHVYEDFANKTFTLPEGVYTVSYIDAETVADIPTKASDSAVFFGWTDVNGEAIADTQAITEGMILVPDYYDVNDYITFEGVQIRLSDPTGLRFICELLDAGKEVEGITVDSYGMVVLPSKVVGDDRTYADYDASVQNSTNNVVGADKITVGGTVEFNGKNYSVGTVEAKVLFDETEDSVLYTTCLIGLQSTADAYATYYTLRPYMIVTANGQQYTLYGDAFRSSIYEVSKKAIEDTSVDGYDIFKGYVDAVEGNN